MMGFWNTNKNSEKEMTKGDDSMSDVTTIDFGEILDISFASKLYSQLKDEVQKNSTVQFVSSGLTRIDASCLQVLATFTGYAKECEIKIEWLEPSEVIKEAADLTGLTKALEINI